MRQAGEKRLDFVVTTTAINLGWLREEKAKGTCSHTHPYFTQRTTPKDQNVALTTLHPQPNVTEIVASGRIHLTQS